MLFIYFVFLHKSLQFNMIPTYVLEKCENVITLSFLVHVKLLYRIVSYRVALAMNCYQLKTGVRSNYRKICNYFPFVVLNKGKKISRLCHSWQFCFCVQ